MKVLLTVLATYCHEFCFAPISLHYHKQQKWPRPNKQETPIFLSVFSQISNIPSKHPFCRMPEPTTSFIILISTGKALLCYKTLRKDSSSSDSTIETATMTNTTTTNISALSALEAWQNAQKLASEAAEVAEEAFEEATKDQTRQQEMLHDMVEQSQNLSETAKQNAFLVLSEEDDETKEHGDTNGTPPQMRRLSNDSGSENSTSSSSISTPPSNDFIIKNNMEEDFMSDKELLNAIAKLEKETYRQRTTGKSFSYDISSSKLVERKTVTPIHNDNDDYKPIKSFKQQMFATTDTIVQDNALEQAMARRKSKQGVLGTFFQW